MTLKELFRVNSKGHLEIGGCDAVKLAKKFGTPLYVMDEEIIRQNCRSYYNSFTKKYNAEVIYAGKAFLTLAMCRIIDEEGLSLDVVSGGELYTALQAGFPADRIYFNGNNKSIEELEMAINAGIKRIIVDNFYELELLDILTINLNKKVEVLLRICPGIEAHTHEYIKTGQIDNKFGFTLSNGQAEKAVKTALEIPNIELKGLHCHIGSQIFEMDSFAYTVNVMLNFIKYLKDTLDWEAEELNLGGGLGIYYTSEDSPKSIEEYADVVMTKVSSISGKLGLKPPKILVEPGRSIVGNAGVTLYTLGSIKNIPGIRKYVSVDGGMNDHPRTALYGAKYEALVANKASLPPEEVVSIAGKCCESGDMIIWDINLPKIEPGDILAVFCTGAYHYSMSSNYNRLPRPAVILVNNGKADIIVKGESYEDLIRNDIIPTRLLKTNKEVISNVK